LLVYYIDWSVIVKTQNKRNNAFKRSYNKLHINVLNSPLGGVVVIRNRTSPRISDYTELWTLVVNVVTSPYFRIIYDSLCVVYVWQSPRTLFIGNAP